MQRRGPTVQQFRLSLSKWLKKTEDGLDKLARGVSYEASFQILQNTPVDTGFLRSSFQPSIGTPSTMDGNGGGLTAVSLVIPQMKAGDVYYLITNAAYARRVEYGFVGTDSLGRYYNQAGRFMVTDTMAKAPAITEKVAAEVFK